MFRVGRNALDATVRRHAASHLHSAAQAQDLDRHGYAWVPRRGRVGRVLVRVVEQFSVQPRALVDAVACQ